MIRGAALAATLVLCLLAAAAGTEAQPRDRVRLIAKEEIEGVVAARARRAGGGLIVMPDGFNLTHRDLIIALAARYGVPAIYFNVTYFSQSGGLISYGPDFTEYFRQAAGYIHRIFNGAHTGELPIQQPTKFELVINLKAAKTLGLAIPQALLLRADRIIE